MFSVVVNCPFLNVAWNIFIIMMMSIPCRLRRHVQPGWSLGAGYNKSPRVPGLSFPSSYRDSTFLSIFAVPNNAVFWITSNLTLTLIRFMHRTP